MIVKRTGPRQFEALFESEAELRAEHETNMVRRGLRLPTPETVAPFTPVTLTLRCNGRRAAGIRATVVAPLPGALALALEVAPDALLAALLPPPPSGEAAEERDPASAWDRVRALTPVERRILAVKADRSERALLTQDRDSQVLNALLKNPRVTLEEVIRVAKSPFITHQTVDLILKTSQWSASVELKSALIHNPKTPQPFALRLLPGLPESELRAIARGAATSMALKTAALKKLQGG